MDDGTRLDDAVHTILFTACARGDGNGNRRRRVSIVFHFGGKHYCVVLVRVDRCRTRTILMTTKHHSQLRNTYTASFIFTEYHVNQNTNSLVGKA